MSLTKYFEPKKARSKRSLKEVVSDTDSSAKRPKLEEPKPPTQRLRDKFSYLLSPTPTLSLPIKYENLLSAFNAVEMAASLLYNRKENIYFDKVASSVERLTSKKFNERVMGQIKFVYPSAYSFARTNDRRISIIPNLEAENGLIPDKMTLKLMSCRKCTFSDTLLQITHRHHENFLASLEKPLKIDSGRIKRWHAKFKLDSVEDIESADIIEEHHDKVTTVKELASSKQGPPKIQEAINEVANSQVEEVKDEKKQRDPILKALRGLPAHLIAKVRENQNRKVVVKADSIDIKDEKCLSRRLPTMIRLIRSIFITERKVSLLRGKLVDKLMESYNGLLSGDEIDAHINLIVKKHSSWIKVFSTSGGEFVSIDKNIDVVNFICE